MSDDDETDETETEPTTAETTPKRKRRSRATTTQPKRTSRFERRAESAKRTLQEVIRLRRPDLDVEGLSFLDVVDRDADAWGRFLAQLAEWVIPFGQLIDLIFGAPLLALVGLAPSVRAARRDLRVRRERVRAEREAERIEDEFERVQQEQQQRAPE